MLDRVWDNTRLATMDSGKGGDRPKQMRSLRMKTADEIRLMAAIKEAFDPHRTLNPNKVSQ